MHTFSKNTSALSCSAFSMALLLFGVLLFGCEQDVDSPKQPVPPANDSLRGPYDKGVFVINEGNMGSTNSSLDFWQPDSSRFYSSVFMSVNNLNLGDVTNDAAIYKRNLYLVVDVSGKVEVVNRFSLQPVATWTQQLQGPRFIEFYNNYAFMSDWSSSGVTIYDVSQNSFVKFISTGQNKKPEQIALLNEEIFVTHSGGGLWPADSIITVIDPVSLTIKRELVVPATPNGIVPDSLDNTLWVACVSANQGSSTQTGQLVHLKPDGTQLQNIALPAGSTNTKMQKVGNDLWFLVGGSIYQWNTTQPAPATWVPAVQGNKWYGFKVIDDKLYAANGSNFNEAGSFSIFEIATKQLLHDQKAGIGTSYFIDNK